VTTPPLSDRRLVVDDGCAKLDFAALLRNPSPISKDYDFTVASTTAT